MDFAWVIAAVLILMALIEVPLFLVIGGASITCFYYLDQDFAAIETVIIEMNRLTSMPVLVALPLFTLAGSILTETAAPKRIMNLMQQLLGWIPGGLGIAALCSCAFFTALTGASGVTIVALGGLLYPILREKGYQENFTLGLLTTSGSRGMLFPPSLPIILYGVIAQLNIDQIYLAALMPGIIMIAAVGVYIFAYEYLRQRNDTQSSTQTVSFSPAKLANSFLTALWDLPIILIIIIGVYGGFTTVPEVSVLVVTYILIVSCFIKKEIHPIKQLPKIISEGMVLSGSIVVILAVALGFTSFLISEEIPQRILESIVSFTDNKYIFLLGLNIFLLGVGCVMDIFSAIIIIVPIIAPIALQFGIHPIHLCIIFLCNLEIGYSTPPVGINLFIASLKFKKPVTTLYKAALPYLAIVILVLILITYVPILSTAFLPSQAP